MHQIADGKARPCERQKLGNVGLDYLPVLIGEYALDVRMHGDYRIEFMAFYCYPFILIPPYC